MNNEVPRAGASLAPDLEHSPALDGVKLPWWAYRSTKPAAAPDYFVFREPRRLVTVDEADVSTVETFRRSNLLYRRLMACRDSGEIIVSLSWTGAQLGPRGMFLFNTAIQRGLVARFYHSEPGRALSRWGCEDLFASLEIHPLRK